MPGKLINAKLKTREGFLALARKTMLELFRAGVSANKMPVKHRAMFAD